jgi:lipid-A-disaccharide synthase
MKRRPTILVTCGETSGDIHAAHLVTELLKRWPDANILALGGEKLAAAGADVIYDIDDFSVIGFSSVLTKLPRFIKLEKGLKRVLENGVDLHIPVDFPGLNLRLARHARKSRVPVLYYISPQVWAWGGGRIEKMVRSVDYMAVILPFEEKIFRERGIPWLRIIRCPSRNTRTSARASACCRGAVRRRSAGFCRRCSKRRSGSDGGGRTSVSRWE